MSKYIYHGPFVPLSFFEICGSVGHHCFKFSFHNESNILIVSLCPHFVKKYAVENIVCNIALK